MKRILAACCLLLALNSSILPKTASALDRIYAATKAADGRRVIRVFAGEGQTLGDIVVNEEYDLARFLAGTWLNGDDGAVVALLKGSETTSASLLGASGGKLKELALGSGVLRVFAADYDGSGLSDIVVQRVSGPLSIYLDPGAGSDEVLSVEIPQNTDAVPVLKAGAADIGFVSGSRKITAKEKLTVAYTDDTGAAASAVIGFSSEVPALLPVRLVGSPAIAFAGCSSSKVAVAGKGFTKSYRNRWGDAASSGFFADPAAALLAFGGRLKTEDGTALAPLSLVQPASGSASTTQLDLTDLAGSAVPGSGAEGDKCATFWADFSKYMALYEAGNWGVTDKLNKMFQSAKGERCFNGTGKNLQFSLFQTGQVSYLPGIVSYGSNTGIGKGPCSKLLSPFDGYMGFVAKNSDSEHGIVYLTPGAVYSNGRVLDPKTFEVRRVTRFAGINNGLRAHFRISGPQFPIGTHIFAAEDGARQTICWRIPDGYTRID